MATNRSVGPPHARWHVVPLAPPRARRRCARCDRVTGFAASGRFRVNAQQHRLDVWLIYECARCADTWNRPVLERAAVAAVDPALLARFHRNDDAAARAVAADVVDLRRRGVEVDADVAVRVVVEPLRAPAGEPCRVEVRAPGPSAIRLDRLVAQALGVSRSRLQRWRDDGDVRVEHLGPDAWRRPVRDCTRLVLRLSSA